MNARAWVIATAAAVVTTGLAAAAGLPVLDRSTGNVSAEVAPAVAQGHENHPYDGRFTLARIRFETGLGSGGFGFGRGGRTPPWAHDFPDAERNLMRVVREVSHLEPSFDGGNIFGLDDPDLMMFPIAYLVEPGFWQPDDADVRALREYLLKGGFLIVDDFRGRDWVNFESQIRRVLPDHDIVEIDVSEPIYHTFFSVESLEFPHPYDGWADPRFFAMYEDNDPTRRIMVVINYDQDIGDYWEYADVGRYPVDLSNEAFKLGINYLVYGMTH